MRAGAGGGRGTSAPESIHPVTRAEDYLTECYVIGWIVFETADGREKRRLCPWPASWATATVQILRELLAKAEAVPRGKLDAERQIVGGIYQRPLEVPPGEDQPDVTDLLVVRSFKYPGGRLWTVCVVDQPEDGGPPALRFTAGARFIDLRPWPRDWADAPDERLAHMLRFAQPRTPNPAGESLGRRWTDRVQR